MAELLVTTARSRAVGVPRRFGAGTLFILVTMYCVLFRSLTLLGADSRWVAIVALFFTGVGAAQVLLFGGEKPRDASLMAGAALCPLFLATLFVDEKLFGLTGIPPSAINVTTIPRLVSLMVILTFVGSWLGYIAGCTTAGVFFAIDRIRRLRHAGASSTLSEATPAPPSWSVEEWLRTKAVAVLSLLNPFGLPERPMRSAARTFLLLALLGLMVSTFGGILWDRVLLVSLIVAAVLTFWLSGFRLCGCPAAVVCIVLSICGGTWLGHAWLSRITILDAPHVSLPVARFLGGVAGGLVGLTMAAALGWLSWLCGLCAAARWPTGRGRLLAATMLLFGLASFGSAWYALRTVANSPKQLALARVMELGGGFWTPAPAGGIVGVNLTGPGVRDTDLGKLAVLSDTLTWLNVSSARISDAGLSSLSRYKKLQTLALAETLVTSEGTEHLRRLPLTSLQLTKTTVGDDGLGRLADVATLQILVLSQTQVTDDGIRYLRQLPALTYLDLAGCAITDAGLEQIAKFPALSNLSLASTQITDAGLEYLKKAMKLTRINLRGTKVSREAIDSLQRALPICRIDADPLD